MCVCSCGPEVVIIVVGARIAIESRRRRGIRPAIPHGARVRVDHVWRIRITIHRMPAHVWWVRIAHQHRYVPDRAMLCTFGISIVTAVLRASVVLHVYLVWLTSCTRTSHIHRAIPPYVQTNAYMYSRARTHAHTRVCTCACTRARACSHNKPSCTESRCTVCVREYDTGPCLGRCHNCYTNIKFESRCCMASNSNQCCLYWGTYAPEGFSDLIVDAHVHTRSRPGLSRPRRDVLTTRR